MQQGKARATETNYLDRCLTIGFLSCNAIVGHERRCVTTDSVVVKVQIWDNEESQRI